MCDNHDCIPDVKVELRQLRLGGLESATEL